MARRYTDRFLEAVDRRLETGEGVVQAWRRVFHDAFTCDGQMCLCGALGAASSDLSDEVRHEVKRFFQIGIDRLRQAGLGTADAVEVLATLEGAMLTANVLEDPSLFDSDTAALG